MSPRGRSPQKPVVAIDGPAGAGKSTLAAYLARVFGFLNLETGAMYRAFALKAMRSGRPLGEEPALVDLARSTRILLHPRPGGNRVLLDDEDVTDRVREPEVTAAASQVSVHAAVRIWMVEQQRAMAAEGGVVMEGRDIGTVVFPDAEVKLFLEASPEVRGERRFRQVGGAAGPETKEAVVAELRERDARDRGRAESPLRPARDAIVLDSTALTLEEVLRRAEGIVRAHLESCSSPATGAAGAGSGTAENRHG